MNHFRLLLLLPSWIGSTFVLLVWQPAVAYAIMLLQSNHLSQSYFFSGQGPKYSQKNHSERCCVKCTRRNFACIRRNLFSITCNYKIKFYKSHMYYKKQGTKFEPFNFLFLPNFGHNLPEFVPLFLFLPASFIH